MAELSQTGNPESTGGPIADEGMPLERELIVVAKRELGLRARREGVASVTGADVSPLRALLVSEGITLKPLFGVREDRLQTRAASLVAETGAEIPDLSIYYRVEAPNERLDALVERLRQLDSVEAAYVKPPAELPQLLNNMVPSEEEPPVQTPDFTARQGYLDAAPGGIDARYAWTQLGGGGMSVRIIDIEGAWRFGHEDLLQNQGGVVGGTQSGEIDWRNHGTAVVGEFGGDRTGFGITGICPDANVRAISIFGGLGSAGAIRQAADMLTAGDIILIELHRPGPRFNFASRNDQRGYIAIEWWPDDFDAIRYATSRGVLVVEAAGNGAENLDDPLYNTRPAGFPAIWTNPFNRANRDSGAILVGAGAPPPGTHGRDHGPDRSRLDFSNWGALIDAQGWGREVTTTGYGDLQGGSNENEWYTDSFSGTSSASPIVVGALGSAQGALRARGSILLNPASARQLLRTTGSAQQDALGRPATQRIGNRPNLQQMISARLELHLSGVTTDGHLWHTIRRGDGSWFGFGDVEGVAGDRGSFVDVDCAGVNGELHVCGVTTDGHLWHTIRRANGSWFGFGDVEGVAGDRGTIQEVACAGVAGELHVCAVSSDGHLWHTIRRANGSWFGFGDVEGVAGDRGSFVDVDCAGVNGELHVCGVTTDGHLWHTIRRANGSWFGFGDVEGVAGDRGTIQEVACAGVAGELHVCAVSSDGHLWHTIRRANGSWFGFGDVEGVAGDRGSFVDVDCAGVNGELHVCGVTTDGHLWHTIRRANGSWFGFGDVESVAGDRGSFKTVSVDGFSIP